ncbi:hypothetical protein AKJ42_01910 [candidate division MSBL1 archaeon SCGC-AAA261C02]|uniref:Uncharacterized protein n=1 Tax=candidate division MSBL1 archaeon SCGC-AAA261C02 TaxID=1698272 RepID=A0A133V0Q5_9EURY|nr:hypothetical protein AKJ42_01910 [candidate division MSBL1 archaeon SCGC-AAA261C02]
MGQIEYKASVKTVEEVNGVFKLGLGEIRAVDVFPHDASITITAEEFEKLGKPTAGDKIKIKLEK